MPPSPPSSADARLALLCELSLLSVADDLAAEVAVDRGLRLLTQLLACDASLHLAHYPDGPLSAYGGRQADGRRLDPAAIIFKRSTIFSSRCYDAKPSPKLTIQQARDGWVYVSIPLLMRHGAERRGACLGILSLAFDGESADNAEVDRDLFASIGVLMAPIVYELDEMRLWRGQQAQEARRRVRS